jgi:hypothetical protein
MNHGGQKRAVTLKVITRGERNSLLILDAWDMCYYEIAI